MPAYGNPFPSAYLDFERSQAAAQLTTPTTFVTDGSPKRRHIWSRFFQGNAVGVKKIQYGDSIEYRTQLSPRNSGESYQPSGIASPTNTQHLSVGTAYWRFYRWNKMYNKQELSFNGRAPLTQQFVDLWAAKQAQLEQDVNDFMEDQFFAVPYKALQEGSGSDAIDMYSIFAHVNPDTSGLFGTNWTGQTWTTKQGLDPTTASFGNNMKPQTRTYADFTWASNTGLLAAFHNMAKDMYWEMPQTMASYWESDTMNKLMFITDRPGHTKYQTMLQNAPGGDMFLAGKQDPSVPDPQYYGVPITWNDTFENAAVYDDGANGLAVATAAAKTGPRYAAYNGNYITPVVKGDNMFVQDEPLRDTNMPDTFVIYVTLDCNLICTSYKRQGFISPSTDL